MDDIDRILTDLINTINFYQQVNEAKHNTNHKLTKLVIVNRIIEKLKLLRRH